MNALELLTQLASDGFGMRLKDNTLYVSPKDKLTDELQSLIRQHKGEMIRLINEHDGLIPISRLPPEGEAMTAAHELQAEALTRTAAQWQQLSSKATTASEHGYYNAMYHLRQAIDKGHKLDVDIWTYIAAQLQKEAIA